MIKKAIILIVILSVFMVSSCSYQKWNNVLEQNETLLSDLMNKDKEKLQTSLKEFNILQQEKFSSINKYVFFYDEGTLAVKSSLGIFLSSKKEKEDLDLMVNQILHASYCFQECSRVIYQTPKIKKNIDMEAYNKNCEITHIILSYLQDEQEKEKNQQQQQEGDDENESSDQQEGEKQNSQNKKSQSDSEAQQEKQNGEKQNEQQGSGESNQTKDKERLLQKMLKEMQENSSKDKNSQPQSMEEQQEEQQQTEEQQEMSQQSLETLMREEQRNQEQQQIQSQRGNYNVQKEW